MVISSLKKELSKVNIIRKSALLYNKNLDTIPAYLEGDYYTQIFLTDNMIIKYTISNLLEVTTIEVIPISNILNAGIYGGGKEYWTIKLKYREITWPVSNDSISREFGELVKELNNMGISEIKR